MLRVNGDSKEADEKFLDKSQQAQAADGSSEAAPHLQLAKKTPDFSSVITQVTTHDQLSYRPPTAVLKQETPPPPQFTWKSKFQSLFCCFAPPSIGYIRTKDGGEPCPPAPPPPPRFHREALIGPPRAEDLQKKTLVLDLDETLVHSSFKPIPNPDYIIPVEIDGKLVDVYVLKRPWMDHFLESVGPRFEVVVFTASLAKYADPLLDLLDKPGMVKWRLFREACLPYEGNYVKDLSCLGRSLSNTIIVDNSPHSYVFQPSNAVPISTFIDNMEDQELLECLQTLDKLEHVPDVRQCLGSNFTKLVFGL